MSKKVRITNTTYLKTNGNPGFGLDFLGNYVGPNRQLVLDLPVIPIILEDWQRKGWIKIEDADAPVSSPGEAIVTLGTVIQEAAASRLNKTLDDNLMEDEFDPEIAKEASLPIKESISQTDAKASVSLGAEEENISADLFSPIPGVKPRSVDDSEKFTVRAPRSHAVGSVVGRK